MYKYQNRRYEQKMKYSFYLNALLHSRDLVLITDTLTTENYRSPVPGSWLYTSRLSLPLLSCFLTQTRGRCSPRRGVENRHSE